MAQGSERFASHIEAVARFLWGDPNRSLSSKTELRYGNGGSRSVDLEKGTWYDHENGTGGGVVAMVERETGQKGRDAVRWLEEHGFQIGDGDGYVPHQSSRRSGSGEPLNREPDEHVNGSAAVSRSSGSVIPKMLGVPANAKLAATYDYRDATGALRFQVCRFEFPASNARGYDKTFRQRRPGERDGEWVWSVKGVEQVPYRIDEIIEAVSSDATIFIVEGEKDADRLAALGAPATCNAMGSGKWPEALAPYFVGARVVIIPDNDEAGRKHRDVVGRALLSVAESVRFLELPDLPPKGDVSDWLDAGHKLEELYDLAATRAKLWTETDGFESRFRAVPWSRLDEPGVEHEWLIKGLLTRGERSMLAGPSQSGKSFFALDLALSVARGVDFTAFRQMGSSSREWTFKTLRGGVIYQAGEGGRGIKKRLRAYRNHHGIGLDENIPFVLMPAALDLHGSDDPTDLFIKECLFWSAQMPVPLELVVIDTLSAATPGANENASDDMSRVLARCERIARELQCHVMIVHHMNAEGSKPRGHTSIFANLDNAIAVRKVDGLRDSRPAEEGGPREIREAVLTKQKDGEDGLTIRFCLRSVDIGTDRDGDAITSCVCEPPTLGSSSPVDAAEAAGIKLSRQASNFLRAVETALIDFGEPPPPELQLPQSLRVVHWRRVRDAFASMSFEIAPDEDQAKRDAAIRQAMKRHGGDLLDRGIIMRQDDWIWLTGRRARGHRTSPISEAAARLREVE